MERLLTPDTYAAWSKDEQVRFHSTSGGAFSEFAKAILAEGGVVAGARYGKDNFVEHVLIDSIEDLGEIRQSKYISSNLGNIYSDVKVQLLKGRIVGFCGAPCQIAGLYAYLGKEYDNLITMDFICRGMNSPKAFKSWLSEIEQNQKSKVTRVWFKYKIGGWKSSPKRTRLDFADGKSLVLEGKKNLFMYGYLSSNLYIRPCCGDCRFKGVPRKSDISFADFWGIEKNLDDDKGTSLLLINSAKGNLYLSRISKNFELHRKEFSDVFSGNPMFTTSAVVSEEAHDFLCDLDSMSFSKALKKHGGYPHTRLSWRNAIRKIKRMIK